MDWSYLKAGAKKTKYVELKIEFFSKKGRKHFGKKGENAGYQHFLLFS